VDVVKSFAFACAMMVLAAPVLASPTVEEMQLPPLSYSDMVYLHPNGCLYTRTDPAGQGRRWVAVTNASFVVPGAKDGPDCTTTLIQPTG
jgi:hypothetical protein